ncbi:cytochrome P450 20A1-like [Tubulanus polymorphus]|uniref:cytochrome P450 20A1-like n=1 Tax=Tubulanus polymorphus TaxID=672921 RepID=UPI003DA246E7
MFEARQYSSQLWSVCKSNAALLTAGLNSGRVMLLVKIGKLSTVIKTKAGIVMISPWTALLLPVVPIMIVATVAYIRKSKKLKPLTGLSPTHSQKGNIPEIKAARSFHAFLADLHDNYGPVATFWYGRRKCCSINSPEHYQQIETLFDRPVTLFRYSDILYGEQSVMFTNGTDGRRRHKLYANAFSHRAVAPLYQTLQQLADDVADAWEKLPPGDKIPVMATMFDYVIRCVTQSIFGDAFKDEAKINKLVESYDYVRNNMEKVSLGGGDAEQMEKVAKEIVAILDDVIKMRRHRNDDDSDNYVLFIEVLLGAGLKDDVLRDDARTFLSNALDKTTSAAAWVLYYLAENPSVQEKCYAEIDTVLAADEILQTTHIGQLRYLRQVMCEALRCSSIVSFTARFNPYSDTTIGQYSIPKGMPIVSAIGSTNQNEELFPNPKQFDPARFDPEHVTLNGHHCFEPFGFAGNRKCPGFRFAHAQIFTLLVTLLQRFRLRLVPGQNVRKRYGIVTSPNKEFYITVEKRL